MEKLLPIPRPRCVSDLTENELAWIDFLRLASGGSDPAPNLERVQALQQALRGASR